VQTVLSNATIVKIDRMKNYIALLILVLLSVQIRETLSYGDLPTEELEALYESKTFTKYEVRS
jgi:hypothetical protein